MSAIGNPESQASTTSEVVPIRSAKTPGATKTRESQIVKSAAGPRTPQGKERTKHNALKHGVFSNVVLLSDEPKADFESLLKGLREHLQPEGALEVALVEKLAALMWRQRRVLAAEVAEIRKSREFLEWNRKRVRSIEAEKQAREEATIDVSPLDIEGAFGSNPREGLIWHIENPLILDRCLELLHDLLEKVKMQELLSESAEAESILKKIYGPRTQEHLSTTLYDDYGSWCYTAEAEEDEREREGYSKPEECKAIVLQAITSEIERLKKYKQELSTIEMRRTEVEKLRQVVPDSPALERLMRYETSLDRNFDRTLTQLERIQRMRKGQMVPPPLKVDVSS